MSYFHDNLYTTIKQRQQNAGMAQDTKIVPLFL